MLDDVEETFHEVALAIEREVALARRLAICPRRNDGLDAADFEMLDEAVAIIAFVGEEGCGFDFLGQDLGLRYVVNVSAGEAHSQRIAQRIDDGVNLGRQSSVRAADRFVRIPFFRAPALCRWALTMVGLFVGGVKLPLALAELGLIDEYEFVVYPRLAGPWANVVRGAMPP